MNNWPLLEETPYNTKTKLLSQLTPQKPYNTIYEYIDIFMYARKYRDANWHCSIAETLVNILTVYPITFDLFQSMKLPIHIIIVLYFETLIK